jgi:hypothetical protein
MNSENLYALMIASAGIAVVPVLVMLWYRKTFFKRSFGIALFGIYSSHFLAGVFEHISCYLFKSTYPIYHFYVISLSYFYYLLFAKKLTISGLKKLAGFLLVLMLAIEGYDFFFRGGLFINNNLAYLSVQVYTILFYFLYLVDTFKNAPHSLVYSRSEFGIYSAIFVFAIIQFLFALIENDISESLGLNSRINMIWGSYVWAYIIYLIISSYLIWKNMRSSPN